MTKLEDAVKDLEKIGHYHDGGHALFYPQDWIRLHANALIAETATLRKMVEVAREALKDAHTFVHNGVELGFIRMPDRGSGDPALLMPKKLSDALTAIEEMGNADGEGK